MLVFDFLPPVLLTAFATATVFAACFANLFFVPLALVFTFFVLLGTAFFTLLVTFLAVAFPVGFLPLAISVISFTILFSIPGEPTKFPISNSSKNNFLNSFSATPLFIIAEAFLPKAL